MHKIHKGLDLPISGTPNQQHIESFDSPTAGVIGHDYHGLKPQMLVQVGDQVVIGDALFRDKANPDVVFASPIAGRVEFINRGLKRSLQSVVVRANQDSDNTKAQIDLPKTPKNSEQARFMLLQSGLWTSFRTRPFSLVPTPDVTPQAVFVNVMDSHPLSADPAPLAMDDSEAFIEGLKALQLAFGCKVFVCSHAGSTIPQAEIPNTIFEVFSGVHPAGTVGVHMHVLAPAGRSRTNLHLHSQDVCAIGTLFGEGIIDNSRVIAFSGPAVQNPRLIRTCLGADLVALTQGHLKEGEVRLLSGSVLSGRKAEGGFGWLGRYHLQVCALQEGRERVFMHYLSSGKNRFSVLPIYLSTFTRKLFDFTTTTEGSERAMVPVGAYERVMPFDFLPTQLLRALIVRDIETAEQLGALELDEEDVALCTFACPGKYEYAPILRENLTLVQKEG